MHVDTIQISIKLSEAVMQMLHCTCIVSFNSSFLLLVVRGDSSLIFAQSQVSAPLNSRPVITYRGGGATPIWSPAWSGGNVRCVAHGLTCELCRRCAVL